MRDRTADSSRTFGGFKTGGQKPGSGGHMGFGPGARGIQMQGEKPKDFKRTLKKFLEYAGRFKIQILVVMIMAAASTAFAIAGPRMIGMATTRLFDGVMQLVSGTGDGIDFDYIGRIILIHEDDLQVQAGYIPENKPDAAEVF